MVLSSVSRSSRLVPHRALLSSSDTSSWILPDHGKVDEYLRKIRGGGSNLDWVGDEESQVGEEEDDGNAAGAEEVNIISTDDEYDSDEEEEEEEEEFSSESEEEEEDGINPFGALLKTSLLSKSNVGRPIEYDELLTPPAMQQMGITIGVMLLSNRIDVHNSKAIKVARYAFLSYLISVQVFLLYVTVSAKRRNDRSPVKLSNPLLSMLPPGLMGGMGGSNNGGMIQTLADQLLSTQTTVLEYDLKQIKKMNGGLLFPMILLYFLHFKLKQVQPLLMQTATGVANLVYSPLFQVYVLGRKLERPFKPPPVTINPIMEALKQHALGGGTVGEGNEEDATADESEEEEEECSDGDEEERDSVDGDRVVVEEIRDADDDSDEDSELS